MRAPDIAPAPPDMLVLDIDAAGGILHRDPLEISFNYPDWYLALSRSIAQSGPLEPGSTFIWKRLLPPSTIVGAVSTGHMHASMSAVTRALEAVSNAADEAGARIVHIAALGTRNGLRLARVIRRIRRALEREERTICVLVSDNDIGEEAPDDEAILLPRSTHRIFQCDGTIYRANRSARDRRRAPRWTITVLDREAPEEMIAHQVDLVRPAIPADEERYPHALVQPLPFRESNDLGAGLWQFPPIGVGGEPRQLPWCSPEAALFLRDEADRCARRLNTTHALEPFLADPTADGAFRGALLWMNEAYVVQRAAGTVVIHPLRALTFCPHCQFRTGRSVHITYRDGRGRVRHVPDHQIAESPEAGGLATIAENGIDLEDAEYAALRRSGFARYDVELATRLISSRATRKAFAALVRAMRSTSQLVLQRQANTDVDIDVIGLQILIENRYGGRLRARTCSELREAG